jgi:hypothetical protein
VKGVPHRRHALLVSRSPVGKEDKNQHVCCLHIYICISSTGTVQRELPITHGRQILVSAPECIVTFQADSFNRYIKSVLQDIAIIASATRSENDTSHWLGPSQWKWMRDDNSVSYQKVKTCQPDVAWLRQAANTEWNGPTCHVDTCGRCGPALLSPVSEVSCQYKLHERNIRTPLLEKNIDIAIATLPIIPTR